MSPNPNSSYQQQLMSNKPDAAKTSAYSSTSANAPSSTCTTTTAHGTMHPISTNTAKSIPASVAIVNSYSTRSATTNSSGTYGFLTEYLQQSAGNWKLRLIMAVGRLSNIVAYHIVFIPTYIYLCQIYLTFFPFRTLNAFDDLMGHVHTISLKQRYRDSFHLFLGRFFSRVFSFRNIWRQGTYFIVREINRMITH